MSEILNKKVEIKLVVNTKQKINKYIDDYICWGSKFRISLDNNTMRVYELNMLNKCINKECNYKYFYLNIEIINDYLEKQVMVRYTLQDHCNKTLLKDKYYSNFDLNSLNEIKGDILEHTYYCESCVNGKEFSCCENFFENK